MIKNEKREKLLLICLLLFVSHSHNDDSDFKYFNTKVECNRNDWAWNMATAIIWFFSTMLTSVVYVTVHTLVKPRSGIMDSAKDW